jgi:hypothetical protein
VPAAVLQPTTQLTEIQASASATLTPDVRVDSGGGAWGYIGLLLVLIVMILAIFVRQRGGAAQK